MRAYNSSNPGGKRPKACSTSVFLYFPNAWATIPTQRNVPCARSRKTFSTCTRNLSGYCPRLESSLTFALINRSISLLISVSASGSKEIRGKLDSNSGIQSGRSRLTISKLRWQADDSLGSAGKRAANFLRSTSNKASSHSSRPSSTQYVVSRAGSQTIVSKILHSVSNDVLRNKDSLCISKFGRI